MMWLKKFFEKYIDPLTRKRIKKFLQIKRSVISLLVISFVFTLSLFSELIANDSPLVVSYKGEIFLPVFNIYKGTDFGLDTEFEPNYKDLAPSIREHGWLLPPPIWWGYNESNRDLDKYPSAPHAKNWLGTDDRGRDVFVRLLYGFRISIGFAIITLLCSMTLGTLLGGTQGFFGGKFDLIGQRFVEIWVSLPYLFMVILIVNIFEPSLAVLVMVLAIFSWMPTSYYMRAECLRLRNQEFAMAATSLGATRMQVFFSHIVPNAITPLVTLAPFIMSLAVASLAFLDFMGLGVQAPTASLGELLKQGRNNFLFAWWLAVFPFLTLVTTLILINFIGEGVRKAFDPRATID